MAAAVVDSIQTIGDMEVQRTHKCGKEVKEVIKFLEEGREELDLAMRVARKKPPPVPRPMPSMETLSPRQQMRKQSSSKQQQQSGHAEWNLTSTIDIGTSGGIDETV